MRPARTVLEQKIRERRQTFEEFTEYAEAFAREHGEPGTLSVRHLQRLAAGRGPNGQPLGPVRPVTARLLEHILGLSIDDLLSRPAGVESVDDSTAELRQMLYASRRVTGEVLGLLQGQLGDIRRLDRELGAVVAHDEVLAKARQVRALLAHSLSNQARDHLAGLLSELYCLAGWQALDLGRMADSWRHYEQAKVAAAQSEIPAFRALAGAGQAFVLVDMNEPTAAVDLLTATREASDRRCSHLLRSWLAAAHGETLAANNQHRDSLRAFDMAAELLPVAASNRDGPYVALDTVHLARWRGHALARCGDPQAIAVLYGALDGLDPTYSRAETALRVDLAMALIAAGEQVTARTQIDHANDLANEIGSARQRQRVYMLVRRLKP